MSRRLLVGADIGYGMCKIITDTGEKLLFPTIARRGQPLNIEKVLGAAEDYVVEVNGQTWYVGNMAIKEPTLSVRAFDANNRFADEVFQVVLATALGATMRAEYDEVYMVTGMPLMACREPQKSEFITFLNTFSAHVKFGSIDRDIKINNSRVFPQAGGIFYSPNVASIKPQLPKDGLVTVLDIGYRTTDAATFLADNGRFKFMVDASFTVDFGMSTLFDNLGGHIANITQNFGITNENAEKAFHSGVCYVDNKPYDLAEIIKQLKSDLVRAIINKYKYSLKGADAQRTLIFAGGGGEALKDELMQVAPEGLVIQDAQFANAAGFLEVARATSSLEM